MAKIENRVAMADLLKNLSAKRATGRQAFLAHKEEIAEAVKRGYTVKEIWQALVDEGAMPVGYESFLRYVRQLPEYRRATRRASTEAGADREAVGGKRVRAEARQPDFGLGTSKDAHKDMMARTRT